MINYPKIDTLSIDGEEWKGTLGQKFEFIYEAHARFIEWINIRGKGLNKDADGINAKIHIEIAVLKQEAQDNNIHEMNISHLENEQIIYPSELTIGEKLTALYALEKVLIENNIDPSMNEIFNIEMNSLKITAGQAKRWKADINAI